MRSRIYLNRNWKYTDTFEGRFLIEPMSGGQTVEIPHSVSEEPFNYTGNERLKVQHVYQRTFFAKKEWRDKRLMLTFEGVAQKAFVYINGVNLIINEGPSNIFEVEIESKINFEQENLITVLVDCRSQLSKEAWEKPDSPMDVVPFGGIYRDVYLTIKEKVSMDMVFYKAETTLPADTRGMTKEKLANYRIPGRVISNIKLSADAIRMCNEGRVFVRQFLNDTEISFQPLKSDGETTTTTGPVKIWDIDSPSCYRIQTDLIFDDVVVDTDVFLIGFRSAVFDQNGFYLNGRRVRIRGVVRHQAFPYVGYAMPESMQRLDARILKEELHVNAVRCCGEFPSPYFLEECDKLGILVCCEVPGYRNIGGENYKSAHLKNVGLMVAYGRNHPSIFLWGVRVNGSVSSELDKQAVELAHTIDPTRAVCGERLETQMPFSEDVYAYTDLSFSGKGSPLLPKGEVTPDMSRPYIVSGYLGESLPVRATDSTKRKSRQINYAASILDAQAFLEDLCGSFAMCMCDYMALSEIAAEDGIAYHGIMDSFRNKKPVAGVFSSQNNPEPEIMIYPPLSGDRERWEGFGEVYIITNADSVRVYRDEDFVCEYTKEDSPFGHMRHGPILMNDFLGEVFDDEDVKNDQARRIKKLLNEMAIGGLSSFLQPGQIMDRLMAKIIYRMNRRQLLDLYEKYVSKDHEYKFEGVYNGEVKIQTTLRPDSGKYLRAKVSALNLIERHGYDVIQIRIMVSNESGEVLSHYNEPVIVNTRGPVRLIGPGIVPLRGGMAGAYVRSIGEEGEAEVEISCGSLSPVKININVLRAPEEII